MPEVYRKLEDGEVIQAGDEPPFTKGDMRFNIGVKHEIKSGSVFRPFKVPSWEEVNSALPCEPNGCKKVDERPCLKCTYQTTLKLMGIDQEQL